MAFVFKSRLDRADAVHREVGRMNELAKQLQDHAKTETQHAKRTMRQAEKIAVRDREAAKTLIKESLIHSRMAAEYEGQVSMLRTNISSLRKAQSDSELSQGILNLTSVSRMLTAQLGKDGAQRMLVEATVEAQKLAVNSETIADTMTDMRNVFAPPAVDSAVDDTIDAIFERMLNKDTSTRVRDTQPAGEPMTLKQLYEEQG